MTAFHVDPHTHARADGPDTSRDAAHSLSDRTTMLRTLLTAFAVRPLTSEEAADECGYAPWATSKRVSDLVRLGYVEDTDQRRPGHSGRNQMVRRITQAGRDQT